MALYPGLRASELVGTDLVQAVPLVVVGCASATSCSATSSCRSRLPLLVGSIPGVYVGAQLSSRLPGGLIRRALAFVLLASALKLFGVSTPVTALILLAALLLAPPVWWVARKRHGFPARPPGLFWPPARSRAPPAEPAEPVRPAADRTAERWLRREALVASTNRRRGCRPGRSAPAPART